MFYKVLLVDDNAMTIESLRTTVSWEKLKLEVIGYADNGRSGLEMIQKFHPDIIITDIYMPELDGLSMIEECQKEIEDARIIFITGFDKFQYASRAIKLSAFDFILKPVDNNELEESLKRAVLSLDKEKDRNIQKGKMEAAVQRAQLVAILAGGVKTVYEDNGFWKQFAKRPDRYFLMAAEADSGITGPMMRKLDFVSFPKGTEVISTVADGEMILFCGIFDETVPWQTIARNISDVLLQNFMNICVAISGIHEHPEDLYIAYQESRKTLLKHNIYGRHSSVEYYGDQSMDSSKHSRLTEMEQECAKLAQKVDFSNADTIWNYIFGKSNGRLRIIRLMLMLFCSKVIQEKMAHYQGDSNLDMTVYDITKLDSVEDARNWLFCFFEELNKIQAPTNSSLVRDVLEYVKNHITEGLMLENVAAQFFVSPNYLSTLIRKETGITYRQHIINAKMDVAKHMLDDTRMRAEDISYAIGYENYISFYNAFKKLEGISPTEYRFRYQNDT